MLKQNRQSTRDPNGWFSKWNMTRMFVQSKKAFLVLALLPLSVTGCLPGMRNGRTQILKALDGQSQIAVPTSWERADKIHEKAELGAADRRNEMYVIVLTESKQDFGDIDLEKFSTITRSKLMKNLSSPEASGPTRLSVNGSQALQYEIGGTIDKMNVVYFHTSVEGGNNYYQVIAWTLRSRIEKNREVLEKIIQSFKVT
jgi:hypothetical protein